MEIARKRKRERGEREEIQKKRETYFHFTNSNHSQNISIKFLHFSYLLILFVIFMFHFHIDRIHFCFTLANLTVLLSFIHCFQIIKCCLCVFQYDENLLQIYNNRILNSLAIFNLEKYVKKLQTKPYNAKYIKGSFNVD